MKFERIVARIFPWLMSLAIIGGLLSVAVAIANLMINDTRIEQARTVATRPRTVEYITVSSQIREITLQSSKDLTA